MIQLSKLKLSVAGFVRAMLSVISDMTPSERKEPAFTYKVITGFLKTLPWVDDVRTYFALVKYLLSFNLLI